MQITIRGVALTCIAVAAFLLDLSIQKAFADESPTEQQLAAIVKQFADAVRSNGSHGPAFRREVAGAVTMSAGADGSIRVVLPKTADAAVPLVIAMDGVVENSYANYCKNLGVHSQEQTFLCIVPSGVPDASGEQAIGDVLVQGMGRTIRFDRIETGSARPAQLAWQAVCAPDSALRKAAFEEAAHEKWAFQMAYRVHLNEIRARGCEEKS